MVKSHGLQYGMHYYFSEDASGPGWTALQPDLTIRDQCSSDTFSFVSIENMSVDRDKRFDDGVSIAKYSKIT